MNQALFHNLLTDGMVEPVPPAGYAAAFFSPSVASHSFAHVTTRQTTLEPSVAGVDVSFSWSAWIIPHNAVNISSRIFGVANTTNSTVQYMLFIQPQSASTLNQVLYFALFTSGAINIGKVTSQKILKNRATHVAISYDGSETAAGIQIYINGVLDSGATAITNGSYTGCVSATTFRFFVSGVSLPSIRYGGRIRDLVLYRSHVWTQSEVDELYGVGVPVTVTGVSFYASITAFYAMHANLTCPQNASFNLGTSTNVSFDSIGRFASSWPAISIVNPIPANTAYTAFGSAYNAAGTQRWQGRAGTTHLLNGDIVQSVFTPASLGLQQSMSTPTVLITNTDDLRGGNAGVIDSKIMNFTSSYDGVNSVDFIRNESTDGLTGLTYGADQVMAVTYNRYAPYGKICAGFAAGETWIPWYQSNLTNYEVDIWKRDSGGTYTKQLVFTDTTLKLTETALLTLPGGKAIMVARSDAAGGGLYLMYSTDSGATWSSPVDTNMAVGTACADLCLDHNGKIIMVWMDRSDDSLYVSLNNDVDDLIADATDWNTKSLFMEGYATDSLGILGYPSLIRNGFFYTLVFSMEFSSSRADLFLGYGYIH